jgi:transposase
MDASKYDVKRIDHLGLIAGFCKEMGLSEWVDSHFPKESHNSHISNGQLFVSMLLNGLGFVSRTLHVYPEYFKDIPTERLLGLGVEAHHINDDVLGRFLDNLYEQGVSALYQELAQKVINHLGLPCRSLNLDATSFHVDGEYHQDIDAQTIHLTPGYSRDHRPDLNQVVLNLITENKAGIPLYMKACSGNSQDVQSFKEIVKQHIKSLKAAYKNTYFIGDAALYTEETIKALAEEDQLFITRVPQKLKEAKHLIAKANQVEWVELTNGYSGYWSTSHYGGVEQRWLLVKSNQAKTRERHILNKVISKSTESSLKSFNRLCRKAFSCEPDAQMALEEWCRAQEFITLNDVVIREERKRPKRGRPSLDAEYSSQFYITGLLSTSLSLKEQAQDTNGLFIIATNDYSENLSMQFILDEYKSQQAVERGFRFLKSPDFLTSSFFLKKPERIEALLMVMTCCLMVYASVEYQIRNVLVSNKASFPDMKKKPTQSPTAKWVFFCFQGISLLTIDNQHQIVTNMMDRQRILLDCLGTTYWEFYS